MHFSKDREFKGKKSIRVLMIAFPFNNKIYAGGSRQAILLSSELNKRISVLAIGNNLSSRDELKGHHNIRNSKRSTFIQFERVENIPTYRIIYTKSKNKLLRWFDLLFLLYKIRDYYDIAHFHSFSYYPFCIFTKLFLKKKNILKVSLNMLDDPLTKLNRPIIEHPLSNMISNSKIMKLIKFTLMQYTDALITISKVIYRRSTKVINTDKIFQIPNFVDTLKFKELENELEKKHIEDKYQLSQGKKALFVGVMSERKGIPELLSSWKYVNNDIKLILVGPINDKEFPNNKFLSIIEEINKKSQKIIYYPFVEDPIEFFQIADLFIFLSKREGLPNAVLEAMSCGVPILASKADWTNGFLNSNVSLLIESFDAKSIAREINNFFENYDVQSIKKFTKNARLLIENNYSKKRVISEYLKLYEWVLNT